MKHSGPLSAQSLRKGRAVELNALMAIDHVVYVWDDGTVTDDQETTKGVYAPEIVCEYSGPFADAQILSEHTAAMVESVKAQGWSLLCGWSRQWMTRGDDPVMHESEYIGGSLADHVRETPGYWVAVSVELHPGETDPEYDNGSGGSESAGWALAHREMEKRS